MDQILDRLWLGGCEPDGDALRSWTSGCVLTLCEVPPVLDNPAVHHIHAPMPDEVFMQAPEWSARVHALRQALRKYPTVFVGCRLGKSRAPSLVAAYLTETGWALDTALAFLVSKRSVVAPHPETWRGVQHWQESLRWGNRGDH